MKKYEHLKAKAREMRKKGMALPEICKRLSMLKGTVFHWIKDMPIERTKKQTFAQKKASAAMVKKYQMIRDSAYNEGKTEASELLRDRFVRDFVVMHLGDGVHKDKHVVGISNSNPDIIRMAVRVIRRFTKKRLMFHIQIHEDHSASKVVKFWSKAISISAKRFKVYRKTNQGNLAVRNWRLAYGTVLVRVCDTVLRSRVQGWLDFVAEDWKNNLGVA